MTARDARQDGIEVHEPIDIESIELHSRSVTAVAGLGWEMVQPGEEVEAVLADEADDPAGLSNESASPPQARLAELEDEHLKLAAELASLRSAARAREQVLQEQLARSRARLQEREDELCDQVAQIASLTLECDGLRSQFRDQGVSVEPAGADAAAACAAAAEGGPVVASLKRRLAERGNALATAREEADRLARERAELAAALAERGTQVAKLMARLTRAEGRRPLQDEFKIGLGRLLGRSTAGAAPGVPPPGSEEPTLALDEPADQAPAAAGREDRPAAVEESAATAVRTQQPQGDVPRRRPRSRRRRPDTGLRRYLISLDPNREEVCELAAKRMYVGRGVEADVRVTDATVSRLHAVLYLERGSTVVEDACSTNGVFVNLRRVRRAVLLDGDTVAFGTVRFQYRVGPASASSSG